MAFALQVENFSYSFPGMSEAILLPLSFSLKRGECACITGQTGAGKSTLLLAIQGLLKDGRASGSIRIDGDGWRRPSGIVFQNADSQILCTTVREEVAFGPENIGFSQQEISRQEREALISVGLTGFETRNVERLSAGEKQRVAIAAILSMKPALVLFDEPTAQLDEEGKANLIEIIRTLKQQGHAVLIAEHDLTSFEDVADTFFCLENGRLQEISIDSFRTGILRKHHDSEASDPPPSGTPAIELDGVSCYGPSGNMLLRKISLCVSRGRFVHLYGANGAGKSTLLKLMAGLEFPDEGTIRTAGVPAPRPELLLGKAALLFQNPQRQFFEDSVYSEVAFTLKMLGYAKREVDRRVREALDLCEVGHLAERAPFTLSFGEQHKVALAVVIAPRPQILLLDEPFAGLDFRWRHRLLDILTRLRHDGMTTVLASHGPLPPGSPAVRRLILHNGEIHEG